MNTITLFVVVVVVCVAALKSFRQFFFLLNKNNKIEKNREKDFFVLFCLETNKKCSKSNFF